MPKMLQSQGIYIKKQSISTRTIRRVPTSVVAMVGSFPKGPMKVVKQILSWQAFEQEYGGLSTSSLPSYCIKQFFDNGGIHLQVIRIGTGPVKTATPFLQGLSRLNRFGGFTILCIPQTEDLSDAYAAKVMQEAIALVSRHQALYLLDPPRQMATRTTVASMESWLANQQGIRHPNVAIYFPRVRVRANSTSSARRTIPASGTMAGVIARIDQTRGIWKAPAGTEAILRNVQTLERQVTTQDIHRLTKLNINPLRAVTSSRFLAWGARTQADHSEWRYLSVRRVALFLEASVHRGTNWVVFESNDEPLWARIRQTVGAFMNSLFRRGAFQGSKTKEAYFVKCGVETTTYAEQAEGLVNIIIGFAPLKPAEFVIVRIQQQAKPIPRP